MYENLKSKKTGIILFNLGGPESLKSVKPFLFNLFYDPAIIRISNPFRWIIAKIISTLREKKAQKIYSLIGGRSSLLKETAEQKRALYDKLKLEMDFEFEIFICMRHWHPRGSQIISKIEEYNPTEIILLPLYPQFSTTTSGSSIKEFTELLLNSKVLNSTTIKTICCYYSDKNFLSAHVNLINEAKKKLISLDNYRILFSAHSLPKKIIKEGDPYQWQIEKTVKSIVDNLNIKSLDYKITYQSRATPVEWLKPDTELEINNACKERKSLIIVPIAFVSEHVETLVELDIEYKAIAYKHKIQYIRVPTLGINDIFINSLSEMIMNFSKNNISKICSNNLNRICPENFNNCPCKI